MNDDDSCIISIVGEIQLAACGALVLGLIRSFRGEKISMNLGEGPFVGIARYVPWNSSSYYGII